MGICESLKDVQFLFWITLGHALVFTALGGVFFRVHDYTAGGLCLLGALTHSLVLLDVFLFLKNTSAQHEEGPKIKRPRRFFIAALAIGIVLLIRLAFSGHYGGDTNHFVFAGPSYISEQRIQPFGMSGGIWTSHFALAFLITPMAMSWSFAPRASPLGYFVYCTRNFSFLFAYYPTYNLFKRLLYRPGDIYEGLGFKSFNRNDYWGYASEWWAGFFIASVYGFSWNCLVCRRKCCRLRVLGKPQPPGGCPAWGTMSTPGGLTPKPELKIEPEPPSFATPPTFATPTPSNPSINSAEENSLPPAPATGPRPCQMLKKGGPRGRAPKFQTYMAVAKLPLLKKNEPKAKTELRERKTKSHCLVRRLCRHRTWLLDNVCGNWMLFVAAWSLVNWLATFNNNFKPGPGEGHLVPPT